MRGDQTNTSMSKYLASLQPMKGRDEQSDHKDHVYLSFGSPDTNLFPTEAFRHATRKAFDTRLEDGLQYKGGAGSEQIKDWIKARGVSRNIHISDENLLITAGAAQGIDFTTRLLINPGDEVWVEAPTYFFALQSFHLAGAHVQMMPMDDQGIDVQYVQETLENRVRSQRPLPKLVYCMPNFHNPTGITLSIERRQQLAELSKEYGFYIIEDDAYSELSFEEATLPAIYSYAPEKVLYLGTFSKVIAPGIRIGWIAAPELFINKMKLLMLGPQTSPIVQEILGELLGDFAFEEHVKQLTTCYRQKRDVMISAIREAFGPLVCFDVPQGGFFIWLRFQQNIDVEKLINVAFEKGVSVVRGDSFFTHQKSSSAIRLCYSFCSKEQIERGITRLSQAYFSLKS